LLAAVGSWKISADGDKKKAIVWIGLGFFFATCFSLIDCSRLLSRARVKRETVTEIQLSAGKVSANRRLCFSSAEREISEGTCGTSKKNVLDLIKTNSSSSPPLPLKKKKTPALRGPQVRVRRPGQAHRERLLALCSGPGPRQGPVRHHAPRRGALDGAAAGLQVDPEAQADDARRRRGRAPRGADHAPPQGVPARGDAARGVRGQAQRAPGHGEIVFFILRFRGRVFHFPVLVRAVSLSVSFLFLPTLFQRQSRRSIQEPSRAP